MLSSLDFTEDGKTDWKAYDRARVQAGEECTQCHSFIWPAKGRPSLCNDCRDLKDDKGEVDHSSLLRCPHCGETREIDDDYELYREGEHDIHCHECEEEFTVVTSVSYSFSSPALIEEKEDAT